MRLLYFNKVIPQIWVYVEIESWQKVINMGTWDNYSDWSQVNWQNLCKAGINKPSMSWAEYDSGISQSSSFHSDLLKESYHRTETSRDYRAAEHPSQWAGWEDGRRGGNASQTPCDGLQRPQQGSSCSLLLGQCWTQANPDSFCTLLISTATSGSAA